MLQHMGCQGPVSCVRLSRQHRTISVVATGATARVIRQPSLQRLCRPRQQTPPAKSRAATVCAAAATPDDESGFDGPSDTRGPESHSIEDTDRWPTDAELDAAAGAATRDEPTIAVISGEGVETESARDAAAHQPLQGRTVNPSAASPSPLDRLPGGLVGRYAAFGAAGFLALTFVIGVVRAVKKLRSPRAVRVKTVNKNKILVEALSSFYPEKREAFNSGEVRSLKFKTRFSEAEMFRKFLWFVLRERKFDPLALQDMLHLKQALGLSQEQVASALRERSDRIYKKYGIVMLETEGMTKGGIERKATCRALFSKLLYLAESEELLPGLDQDARDELVRNVFGATQDDIAQLRIVSLYDVDTDTIDRLASGVTVDDDEAGDEADVPATKEDDSPPAVA